MSTISLENLAGRRPGPLGKGFKVLTLVLVVLGVIAFAVGLKLREPKATWAALLTNYMLFTQFGIVGLVFAAIANITNSTWMRPLKRIAESFTYFLPVSLVLLVVLFFGRHELWDWTHLAEHHGESAGGHAAHFHGFKAWWLSVPFFWARQFAIVGIFNVLAYAYRRVSLAPDLHFLANKADKQGLAQIVERSQTVQRYMAPAICLLYAIFWSLHAWDMIMSIDWMWFSAMFGGWQFAGGLLALWALMNLYATYFRKKAYLDDIIGPQQYHDLGKLMFGFGIFWTYLMWAQFLPIWYGNLPEETPYVLLRLYSEPWRWFSYVIPFLTWLVPFWVLMPVATKKNPVVSGAMGVMILVGLWLERYDLITPTLSPDHIPLGLLDAFITAGFLGGFALITFSALAKGPILPITDPYLKVGEHGHH